MKLSILCEKAWKETRIMLNCSMFSISLNETAYFGRVEYPPSFENRAIVFDLSLCSVLLRPESDSGINKS